MKTFALDYLSPRVQRGGMVTVCLMSDKLEFVVPVSFEFRVSGFELIGKPETSNSKLGTRNSRAWESKWRFSFIERAQTKWKKVSLSRSFRSYCRTRTR